jgi:hypothetical protein
MKQRNLLYKIILTLYIVEDYMEKNESIITCGIKVRSLKTKM